MSAPARTASPGSGDAQVSSSGRLDIDHVAHFVPDLEAAHAALGCLGFTTTPLSVQAHRLEAGGPLVPAGTANRCVMLERGYLEFLTATGDTPLAHQLGAQMARYTGVHLIAFGTANPGVDHARLAAAGFEPMPPVALQRPIETPLDEQATARFTVVRVPAGRMAEGRIQFCQHHTPELLWQARWSAHPNGAVALTNVIVCVADASEAARRYERFTGLPVWESRGVCLIETARGTVTFVEPSAVKRRLGLRAPSLPWIAGYALETRDLAAAREHARSAECMVRDLDGGRALVELPAALGGVLIFEQAGSAPLAFEAERGS